MVGHEIGAAFAAVIGGAVIISMFSPNSAASAVFGQTLSGVANLVYAINAPVRGGSTAGG